MLNSLYRYAYSLSNSESDGYDLLHDALARFLARKEALPEQERAPYLRRMIRNQFIDQLRREQRLPLEVLDTVEPDIIDDAFIELERVIISQQTLDNIWDLLLPLERELVHLWAVEGFNTREISQQLHIPQGTILSRIHRIRKKIEPLMVEYQSL
jgi:RNA polymerase sigma-70 factor (ECF subfamily)